jgi:C4-dicarboxylate-specific signal transduction histidine kinase
LNEELHKKGTLLRPQFADDLPVVVGDRIQLQQVILNLLTNAADAMLPVNVAAERAWTISPSENEKSEARLDLARLFWTS